MKRKGFISIVAIILICAVLFGIISFADGEEASLKIEIANLEFADTVYLLYGVAFSGIDDPSEIKMYVWTAENYCYGESSFESAESILECEKTVTVGGKEYAVFKYMDCGAKNMGDELIAVAVCGDAVSAPCKYSILEYALKAKNDTTYSEDSDLMNLVDAMLRFGAAAQLAFEYKTERLVTGRFDLVKLKNAHFSDGIHKGVFMLGETACAYADDLGDNVFWYDMSMRKLNTCPAESFEIEVSDGKNTYFALGDKSRTEMNLDFSFDGAQELEGVVTGESINVSASGFSDDVGLTYTFNSGTSGSKWTVVEDANGEYYLALSSKRLLSISSDTSGTVLNSVKKSGAFTLCLTLAKDGTSTVAKLATMLSNKAISMELFSVSSGVVKIGENEIFTLGADFYTVYMVFNIEDSTVTVYTQDSQMPILTVEVCDSNGESISSLFEDGEIAFSGNVTSAGALRIKRIAILDGDLFEN